MLGSVGGELVHVVLKPDALEFGLEETLVREIENLGGYIVAKKKVAMNLEQVEAMYPDFSHPNAWTSVVEYLTSRETVHLVVAGRPGLHARLNLAKGRTGSGTGIRARYITWYTPLTEDDFHQWEDGHHPDQGKINMEMFCRNLLHVATNQTESITGLQAIWGMGRLPVW